MTTFLIIVVLVLAVVAITQLIRVSELASSIRSKISILPTERENRGQAYMMLATLFVYFGFFLWLVLEYGDDVLPIAASVHGKELDALLNFNFLIITIVFVVTHIFLFYFAFKYYSKKGRKAHYFTHSNKLELIWTIIPAVFLFIIIFYGLSAWNDIMDEAPSDSITVELYSKQFDWTARYTGSDDTLGLFNYNLVSGTNPLGLMTSGSIEEKAAELSEEIDLMKKELTTWPEDGKKAGELREEIERLERHHNRVLALNARYESNEFNMANDDIAVKGEFHIPVDTMISFQFRSQDVIHSAYMPHFRAQMNAVPGMLTNFKFIPDITTKEMREITGDPEFKYILLCNKICGAAHYNMQMEIVVETWEEYQAWLSEQKPFASSAVEGAEGVAQVVEKTK